MDFVAVLGVVGSVASLISLFLPASKKKEKIIHALYVFFIAITAGVAIYYQQINSRNEQAKAFAAELLKDSEQYSAEGFNLAALAFLEANKEIFPDSYARAKEMCAKNDCVGAQYGNSDTAPLDHAYNQINVQSALKGLIRGIASRYER